MLPFPGHPLRAKFCGPYIVERKVNDIDYIMCMPERRKKGYVILTCSRNTMLTAVHPLHHIRH